MNDTKKTPTVRTLPVVTSEQLRDAYINGKRTLSITPTREEAAENYREVLRGPLGEDVTRNRNQSLELWFRTGAYSQFIGGVKREQLCGREWDLIVVYCDLPEEILVELRARVARPGVLVLPGLQSH